DRYVAAMIAFVRTHPAFLPLLDAPSSTVPLGPRNRLRELVAELLGLLAPGLARDDAERCAEVVLNVNNALMQLYALASAQDRRWIGDDYRTVVHECLAARIRTRGRGRRADPARGGD